jgi:protein-L-isoaspartate(D-aspartate) O-methyltransferase
MSNEKMIEKLLTRHNPKVKTKRVIDTMLEVDRKYFCKYLPYEDSPQSIGYSATVFLLLHLFEKYRFQHLICIL